MRVYADRAASGPEQKTARVQVCTKIHAAAYKEKMFALLTKM